MESTNVAQVRGSQNIQQDTHRNAIQRLAKPSFFDLLFFSLGMLSVTILGVILLNADGDLARHLRVGEVILTDRALPTSDPFSNTKAGETFLQFEWGSEVVFALFHRLGGLAAVLVLTGIIIGTTYGLVAIFLERRGVNPLLTLLATALSISVALVHWLPRPHMFSALGAIVLLFLLERERSRGDWVILPFFVVWANLHGAFTWGLALIALYLVGSVGDALLGPDRRSWREPARSYGAILGLALLGSLINPFGYQLHTHIIGYLNEDFIISHTADFVSPDFRELGPQIFMITVLAMVMGFAVTKRRPPLAHLLVICATIAFSLNAVRNIPLYAVTAVPLFALFIDATWRDASIRPDTQSSSPGQGRRVMPGLLTFVTFAVMSAIAVTGGNLGGAQVTPDQFSESQYPVQAVEAARAANLEGTMFNEFVWGGYILYAWPEQRVFIDGQTAFYGEELTRAYMEITALEGDWRQELSAREIDFVILPPTWPLALELQREPGWYEWYRDDVAVILISESSTSAIGSIASPY